VLQYTAEALARGEIVGWVNGRAEVGARALGHRSILANPAMAENHRKVNHVKQREQWRPLAPSVLAEEADSWFDGLPTLASPYMQITATVRPEVREQVPAITHVDGSARLQTVGEADAPIYHALIAAFFALVGVPMLMNTSFNLARMPIVESPRDALACFLEADEALSLLVLHGRLIRRRPFPTGACVRWLRMASECL
jgi:carbamoyltransferase